MLAVYLEYSQIRIIKLTNVRNSVYYRVECDEDHNVGYLIFMWMCKWILRYWKIVSLKTVITAT